MVEGERLKHLAVAMIVKPINSSGALLEADIVKSVETGTLDVGYLVIRHQEMFLRGGNI